VNRVTGLASAATSAALALTLTMCGGGGTQPAPHANDPVPNADPKPSNVAFPITFSVAFLRKRNITVDVYVHGARVDQKVVVGNAGGGNYSRTFYAQPGESLSMDATPTPDADGVIGLNGRISCSITHFTKVLPPNGYVLKQAGSVHCGATAPLHA
jgi:hypothetical protein